MDLGEAVERRTGRGPRRQLLTRFLRVPCGITPLPVQLHDLGAIEQALSPVAHQARLTGTPFSERHRPLVGTPQVECLLTRLEDDAVDVTGEDWRHVAGNHRHHRFVEARNTLRDLSKSNQRAPPAGARQRGQVAVAEAAGDLGRPGKRGVAGGGIALHKALNGGRNQQIPTHGAVEVRVVEDTLSSREPSGRGSNGPPLQQAESEPEGRSSGPFTLASIEEGLMRARAERLALGIAADEVGRRRETFQVLRFEEALLVGCCQ
jgi:hypothetical protein